MPRLPTAHAVGYFSRAPPVLGLAMQRGADIECHEVQPGLRHSRLGFQPPGEIMQGNNQPPSTN
ncbi:MAG: hypothetical protein IH623_01325 [Verrucomicrobia bacterium]|nr:hypothetical protein [Verrucomicrobiota bacterium]